MTIGMHDQQGRSDIERHVWNTLSNALLTDKEWSQNLKQHIVTDLTKKANGVFLYVACHLTELDACGGTGQVRDALKKLPKSIEETYARILERIPQSQRSRARAMLIWLHSSRRDLIVREIAEAAVVNPDDDTAVRLSQRFAPPEEVLTVLSHLVEVVGDHVVLAHFSVKEYLSSEGNYERVSFFRIEDDMAYRFILGTCFAYMVYYSLTRESHPLEDYPLLLYTCQIWWHHARMINPDLCSGIIDPSTSKFFPLIGKLYSLSTSFAARCGSVSGSTSTWDLQPIPGSMDLELALRNVIMEIERTDGGADHRGDMDNLTGPQATQTYGRWSLKYLLLNNGVDRKLEHKQMDIPPNSIPGASYKPNLRSEQAKGHDAAAMALRQSTGPYCPKTNDGYDTSSLFSWSSIGTSNDSLQARTNHDLAADEDFIAYMALVEDLEVDLLPANWQPQYYAEMERSTSATYDQYVDMRQNAAFRRFKKTSNRHMSLTAALKEVSCVANPTNRQHQNIIDLQGFCWDLTRIQEDIQPILIYEKARWRDLHTFMDSKRGVSMKLIEKLKICADIGAGLAALLAVGKY